MNDKLISVIVPVYNVEKYLEKSINSLLEQTYKNLEIIIVDDGSTDNSSKICDDFLKKDSRIKVFHKINGGQGSARNLALDNMNGEFVCFLDSDDSVYNDYIEFLYKQLIEKKLDVACANFEIYNEKDEFLKKHSEGNGFEIFTGKDAIKNMWYSKKINIGPWGKLYKAELWRNVRFKECYSEDFAIMHYIYIQCEKVGYFEKCLLKYLARNNSSIRSEFNKNKLVMLDIVDDNFEFCLKHLEIQNAARAKAVSVYFHLLFQIPNSLEYKKDIKKIEFLIKKQRKKVLKDKEINKKVKCALILSYLSFFITRKIFKIWKKNNIA